MKEIYLAFLSLNKNLINSKQYNEGKEIFVPH